MKFHIILPTFLTLFFIGCNPKPNSISNEKFVEELQKREFKKHDEIYQNAGKLIGEIEFNIKATDEQKKDWEEGVIPWISIEKTNQELNQLINPDVIVITQKTINIIIDYPLNNPANFVLINANGFSRKDLIIAVSKKYHEIYSEEEKTAKTKTIPIDKRTGIINRNQTDGKYGI